MPKAFGGLIEEALTESIIGAFYDVFNTLGPGFVEHVYAMALERELIARGHRVAREYAIMVYYKGQELTWQRLEWWLMKRWSSRSSPRANSPTGAPRQLLSYLKATRLEVGLLLHFGPEARFFRIVSTNK